MTKEKKRQINSRLVRLRKISKLVSRELLSTVVVNFGITLCSNQMRWNGPRKIAEFKTHFIFQRDASRERALEWYTEFIFTESEFGVNFQSSYLNFFQLKNGSILISEVQKMEQMRFKIW